MEKTTRFTKAMRFEDIKAMLNDEPTVHGSTLAEVINFIDYEMNMLVRKNSSGSKKETKTQIENAGFREEILRYLATLSKDDVGVTCAEVSKHVAGLEGRSQKTSALLRQLGENGENKVKKTIAKGGVSLFSLV